MTTRRDVERLAAAQRTLADMAKADLARLVASLDLTRPEAARNILLEVLPGLTSRYGDAAAVAAAEWYETVHPGAYTARLGATAATGQVEGAVRYYASHLFTDHPLGVVGGLSGAVQRFVANAGRDTIFTNVSNDPSRPRFARVPRGAKTCAWCGMLASRGFDYATRESAGEWNRFHNDCDCGVIPAWDNRGIEGYDPDRLYAMYTRAAGPGRTDSEVAAELRRLFPDEFSDGIHVH